MVSSKITCWDRQQQVFIEEKVLDEKSIHWLYGTKIGQLVTRAFFSRTFFSRLYARFYESSKSRKKIAPFIKEFDIDMEEFKSGPFQSFNEFFVRSFKPGSRTFIETPEIMPAFVEGRYLAWQHTEPDQGFPVKGTSMTAEALMGDHEKSRAFQGGPVIIARLCPHDYHRFHFVDSGDITDYYRIPGTLHSVNPYALSVKGDILCSNKRDVTIQDTENFGHIAYIEVGAMTVGRIVQHHKIGSFGKRGQEKGYFKYGGSTVIIMGEKGAWLPDQEIVGYTNRQIETIVILGTPVAYQVRKR